MTKVTRKKNATSYRSVGETYDGVRVIAPKTRSKTFTGAEVRTAIKKALQEAGVDVSSKPLRESDALRVEKRADGKFSVKRKGAKRASAVVETQKDAIARAKALEPEKSPIAKRVRRSTAGKKGTWRET